MIKHRHPLMTVKKKLFLVLHQKDSFQHPIFKGLQHEMGDNQPLIAFKYRCLRS